VPLLRAGFPSGEAERSTPDKEKAPWPPTERRSVIMTAITTGPLPQHRETINGYLWTRDVSHDPRRAAKAAVALVRGDASLTNLTHRQAMALPGVTPTEYWLAYRAAKKNGG
jgi:hypothetical protein